MMQDDEAPRFGSKTPPPLHVSGLKYYIAWRGSVRCEKVTEGFGSIDWEWLPGLLLRGFG